MTEPAKAVPPVLSSDWLTAVASIFHSQCETSTETPCKCHLSNKAWPIKDDWHRLIHQAFIKCKFSKISLMHYLSFSSEHKKGCCSLSHTTSSHRLACSAGVFNNASVLHHCRLTGRWQTRFRRLENSCDAGLPVFGWLWITPSMHNVIKTLISSTIYLSVI